MGKKQIQRQLSIFVKRVREKFQPEKIILFGSYAKNEANQYSDVDILVVSELFSKMKEKERFDELYKLSNGIYPDINAFGFTPEEISSPNKLTTLYEAVHTGKLIS